MILGRTAPALFVTFLPAALCAVSVAETPTVAPDSVLAVSTLHPKVGQRVELRLHLPTGDRWQDANIANLLARTAARQWSIPIEPQPGSDFIGVRFDRPGPVLLVLAAGSASQRNRSDSWQRTPYCCKVVLTVESAEGGDGPPAARSQAGITSKVGHKIEILPLIDPSGLRVGDDLPVRVYYQGSKVARGAVTAFALDSGDRHVAARDVKTSDSTGTTWFRIDRSGPWLVRFEHEAGGVKNVADLIFEVAAPASGDVK